MLDEKYLRNELDLFSNKYEDEFKAMIKDHINLTLSHLRSLEILNNEISEISVISFLINVFSHIASHVMAGSKLIFPDKKEEFYAGMFRSAAIHAYRLDKDILEKIQNN